VQAGSGCREQGGGCGPLRRRTTEAQSRRRAREDPSAEEGKEAAAFPHQISAAELAVARGGERAMSAGGQSTRTMGQRPTQRGQRGGVVAHAMEEDPPQTEERRARPWSSSSPSLGRKARPGLPGASGMRRGTAARAGKVASAPGRRGARLKQTGNRFEGSA